MKVRLLLLSLIFLFAPQNAFGKGARNALADKLDELSKKVDVALQAATEVPGTVKLLQGVQEDLTQLRTQVKELSQRLGDAGAQSVVLKQIDTRVGDLELKLSTLSLQLAGKAPVAGYDGGFFIQSSNRRFRLRLGGLVQAGYSGTIYAQQRLLSGTDLGQDKSEFMLHRARIKLDGYIYERQFSYFAEFDFGTAAPGPVLQAYAELQLVQILAVRAGRLKVPVGRQLLAPAGELIFRERSGVVQQFAPGWDLGGMLYGRLIGKGLLTYQVGVFNGAGSHGVQDDNIDFLYAFRLSVEPLGRLARGEGVVKDSPLRVGLGASFSFNLAPTDIHLRQGETDATKAAALRDQDGDGDVDNVGIYTFGAELVARWQGLSYEGEFFYRLEDPGAVAENRAFWGIYNQLSYHIFRMGMQFAIRHGYWEPHHYGESGSIVRPRSIHELGGSLAVILWQRRIRLQAEYGHQWLQDLASSQGGLSESLRAHRVMVGMQIGF
jgi:hypothetical protein